MSTQTPEQRLQRLEAIESIRHLKSRYLFSCDRKDPAGMRACFVDGPVRIDYGVVGTFNTADALVTVYTQIACHPHMVEMHHGMNPQIEVVDETHARGTWSLHYFLINTQNNQATQLAGYYEDEYRKDAGLWKISATRFVATSTLSLDLTGENLKKLYAGGPPPAA
jgi:hypothetical protein